MNYQIDMIKPSNGDVSALIVFKDSKDCKSLEDLVVNLGIAAETETESGRVIEHVGEKFFNLVLLDGVLNGISGLSLLPDIVTLSPDSQVIILTGRGDKHTAVEAVEKGAFGYLEKPVELPLLSHVVQRALETQRTELEFRRTHADLMAHKSMLEQLNRQLADTNTALSVLAKNIDGKRQEVEGEIVTKIKSFILPIVEKLQVENSLRPYRSELSALIDFIDEVASKQGNGKQIAAVLSASEFRIASLIKNGLTTQAIADHLCVSPGTVKTHRKNIRKKLGINGNEQYLGDYLRRELGDGGDEAGNRIITRDR
jgi:FixJ family two-component response regulator